MRRPIPTVILPSTSAPWPGPTKQCHLTPILQEEARHGWTHMQRPIPTVTLPRTSAPRPGPTKHRHLTPIPREPRSTVPLPSLLLTNPTSLTNKFDELSVVVKQEDPDIIAINMHYYRSPVYLPPIGLSRHKCVLVRPATPASPPAPPRCAVADVTNLGQLRPVSLTHTFEGGEGRVADVALTDKRPHIDGHQFGNLKGRSTTQYMVFLLDAILKGLEQRNTVAQMCLIDFKNAFDNVDHSVAGVAFPDVHLDANPIPCVDIAKVVRLVMNSNLTWQDHVDHIVKKASKLFFMLFKARSFGATQQQLVQLYCQRIRPCAGRAPSRYQTRHSARLPPVRCRTERYRNSTIPYVTRLANK
ncbi:hypothetical protein O3P69_017351 [Scylla paramamosain]|uniref:Reverse transcriptase domain-containing protein n=1 Tax=Scylla paramamosain TaxID=85552 RepID=A0AAW0SBX2_SCYPA